MISLTVIMNDGSMHCLMTNLERYELYLLMKELKSKKQIREVR